MAYSYVVYTGNAVTTDFAVPFPYLDPAHVAVTVNGAATTFTWVGSASVRISPAPAAGSSVRVSRSSNRQSRLANYADAQVLTEDAMDADALQLFYVAQEAFDAVADAAVGGDMRRSFNLSDVLDINAARQNIGALSRFGDTMAGPLGLYGPPTSPNEAASKSYVDAMLAGFSGSGVTSFNSRSGAIALLANDVLSALGYTPLNKAGDTMAGPLILQADPVAPLGAVTKQYVDNRVGSSLGTGEYVFAAPGPDHAAAVLNKVVATSTTPYAGAASLAVRRNGGQAMTSFRNALAVTVPNGGPNGDIAMDVSVSGISGPFVGLWGHSFGPRAGGSGTWQPIGMWAQASERVGDQGYKIDRNGNATISLLVSPGAPSDIGDGQPIAYNTSFGIAFTAATPGSSTQRLWTPMFYELDCTVPNGVQALHRGGSSAANAPASAIVIRDYFKSGIDMRSAVFDNAGDNTAIWLAQGQAIHFGPIQRMYVDPSGNLTFFDNIAGSRTLASMTGGGGTDIRPLNNSWTGTNKFLGSTPEAVIGSDPPAHFKVSRSAPAGGVVTVQAGMLVNTITQPTTQGFEWNALFRLENYADQGENVAMYSKATKYANGATWAGVFEARSAMNTGQSLYGLEIDLCSDGLDPFQNQQGIAVFYGAHTNTFGGGAPSKQTNGLLIWPFQFGRNYLQNGVHVGGYCDYVFRASASGTSAFVAAGSYAGPVIDIGAAANSPIAISMGAGQRMLFTSGSSGGNQTWYSGGFVPNYVGAIEVLIDGNKRYIPIALNHP